MKKKTESQPQSNDLEKNLNRALRFLSFRPRSEKEIRDYLIKKIKNQKSPASTSEAGRAKIKIESQNEKTIEETINSVVSRLKKQKFLNDAEFAKWWIEQRTVFKPKALRIVKFELKQKGISDEIIQRVLEDKEFKNESDFEKAKKLAEKRVKRYKNIEDKRKVFEKLVRFLASKGFDYETIKRSLDGVLSK